jgi:hypothetical protein
MRAILTLSMFSVLLLGAAQPSGAVPYHPWCARLYDRSFATVCSYDSQAQCLATVSGVGGFCLENPASPPAVGPPYPPADGVHHRRAHAKRYRAPTG